MLKSRKFILVILAVILVLAMGLTACKGGAMLKVAAVVPTGYTGESMRNAINMSVDEINAAGGILGKKNSDSMGN